MSGIERLQFWQVNSKKVENNVTNFLNLKKVKSMKIKPIGKRVLIKPVKEEEKTKGGIFIPETAKEKKKQGIVVELGTIEEKELPIKKGDVILYAGYSSEEMEVDGEKYLILDSKDIIAKIEG
jgi:chaperonin GroES